MVDAVYGLVLVGTGVHPLISVGQQCVVVWVTSGGILGGVMAGGIGGRVFLS